MMSAMKTVKFGCRLLKAKILRRNIPFVVQFSVTNRCNYKCRYCYAKYYERKTAELDLRQIFKMVDDLCRIGTVRINLVGGEPLLRKDIGEIIDYITGKGIECAMTSNGSLVREKINDIRKLDLLCLSLDGDKAANDYNRHAGSYDKVMEAIDSALERGIKVQIATVLTKESIPSIDFLVNLANKKKIKIAFTTPITQASEGGSKAISNIPSDRDLKAAIKKIISLKRMKNPILFSYKPYKFALDWPIGYDIDKIIGKKPGFKFPKCYAGKYWGIIDVNGDVYPCPALVGVVKPHNCIEKGFKEAWREVSKHACFTCHLPCNNEFNYLFALDPETIIDTCRHNGK